MNLKTYQAYTMAQALAAVKRDLGADAVILNTRSFRRGGLMGIGRRTIIEVTAVSAAQAREKSAPSTPPSPARMKPRAVAAQRAYAGTLVASPPGTAVRSGTRDQFPVEAQPIRTRRLAQALNETQARRPESSSPAPRQHAPPPSVTAVQTPVAEPKPPVARVESQSPDAPVARRYILKSPDESKAPTKVAIDTESGLAGGKKVERADVTQDMQDELSAIRDLVGQVLHRQVAAGAGPTSSMPKQLFDMYLKLISQDISDDMADQIVNHVRAELDERELENERTVRAAVLRHLAKYIPVARHDVPVKRPADGRPLTIALIGPTGVGKTTTLAKLAASFKLRHGKRVGLITSDTYRIAAVDQLRTYANIIGLPLHVALAPEEMQHATQALAASCDVILIDTAGRSQKDANRITQLKQFIDAAKPHEVHLVLSSTAGEKVLLSEAQAFSAVGVHKIMLTKLDEAVSFGMLVNVIRQVGKELSFVTTGQEVPAHIEAGKAERLAELVLNGGGVWHGGAVNT